MHSPFSAFEAQATARPNATMLLAPASAGLPYAPDGFRRSYGEMRREVSDIRARFADAGYGAGHRVALLLENRPEFFSHWLALNALGVSIVPINPDLRPAELDYQLDMADVDLIVTHAKQAPTLSAVDRDRIRVIEVGEAVPAATSRAMRQTDLAEDECALLFTSGSTGKPKG